MWIRGVIGALFAAAVVGCSSEGAPASSSTSASTATGGGGAGGAGGGGPAPVLDPSLFDCTATRAPVRVSATPVGCATDPTCTAKLVCGHRGAGGELGVLAPEDSLAAVRAAIVLGIDFVETDPRPTKDGVLVNLHDPELDRTTDGTGAVSDRTLAEIRALHLESPDTPGDFSCEGVPTLEEVLEAAKGKVHVLVDANKTDRVDLLVAAIQKTGTLDWAIFDTSSVDKIDAAIALEPKLVTMIRIATAAEVASQLGHFAAHPPVIVEVDSSSDAAEVVPPIHAAKNRAFTDVFAVDLGAGLTGDGSGYGAKYAAGYDALQSDRPDLVLRALGRWPPPAQP